MKIHKVIIEDGRLIVLMPKKQIRLYLGTESNQVIITEKPNRINSQPKVLHCENTESFLNGREIKQAFKEWLLKRNIKTNL